MTDKEIVERAKEAEKRTNFGELVHSPISKGVNSAYGIGFVEGMVEYRNSMQEEPSEIKSKCMYANDNYTDEDRKVLCDGCEEDCKCNKKERKKEPSIPDIVDEHFYEMLGEDPVSDNLEKIVEEIAEPTILKAYGTKELARRLRNTIYGTSVSEDLEEAAVDYGNRSAFTDVDPFNWILEIAFKDGACWQKKKMMASGTDVTVHIEAGNCPYIPQIELYDYDKDIPLAKEGDKYKVILIKED